MCGSTIQLGCTSTLDQIWTGINERKHNTKRFVVVRNDKIIYDQGQNQPYYSYSASKGLLGAPTLVYAMSKCGMALTDRAAEWLGHGEGARWDSEYPWRDITIEDLATTPAASATMATPGRRAAIRIPAGKATSSAPSRVAMSSSIRVMPSPSPGPRRAEQRAGFGAGQHLRVQQCWTRLAQLRRTASLRPEPGRHL